MHGNFRGISPFIPLGYAHVGRLLWMGCNKIFDNPSYFGRAQCAVQNQAIGHTVSQNVDKYPQGA